MVVHFFFFKQKTAYEMRISDWSSDVCSSDLAARLAKPPLPSETIRKKARSPKGRRPLPYRSSQDLRAPWHGHQDYRYSADASPVLHLPSGPAGRRSGGQMALVTPCRCSLTGPPPGGRTHLPTVSTSIRSPFVQ